MCPMAAQRSLEQDDALVALHDLLGQLERGQLLGQDPEQEARGVLAPQRLVVDGDPDGDVVAERRENRRLVKSSERLAVRGPATDHAQKHTDHSTTRTVVLPRGSLAWQ